MYLHVGSGQTVRGADMVGIFDLDNTTASVTSRAFLARADREGRTRALPGELPKCFVLLSPARRRGAKANGRRPADREEKKDTVFFLRISSASLRARAEASGGGTLDLSAQPADLPPDGSAPDAGEDRETGRTDKNPRETQRS